MFVIWSLLEILHFGQAPLLLAAVVRQLEQRKGLISNAMKHTTGVRASFVYRPTLKGDSYRFELCDDGVGIPKEFHEKIFGLFATLQTPEESRTKFWGVVRTIEEIARYRSSEIEKLEINYSLHRGISQSHLS